MKLTDHLNAFSVDDLRTLAERRLLQLNPELLRDRQSLVRSLASAIGSWESVYSTITALNTGEMAVLQKLVQNAKHASISRLSTELEAQPEAVRPHLESLRLFGLAFPEGDWEHIAVPPSTLMVQHYLPAVRQQSPVALTPPTLQSGVPVPCAGRTGSFSTDMAEFMARVARGRFRLTQKGTINRRDLKAMETSFGVTTPGYTAFLSQMASGMQLIGRNRQQLLEVFADADVWLTQDPLTRLSTSTLAWVELRGYPESVPGEPADAEYVPAHVVRQRLFLIELFHGWKNEEGAIDVKSLAEVLRWYTPHAFSDWSSSKDSTQVAARLARSLHWLGAAEVDQPELPAHVRPTAAWARVVEAAKTSVPAAPPVPDEDRFYVQPNAEVFAPPNLAPRTLFHLRRVTGEKKGGASGMYPLNAESIRRALDSGLTVEAILTFLERFSLTGLPGTVKALVETTGRQHGRIRLIPAGYILVTDDAALLKELGSVKQVSPYLGAPVTDRVTSVAADEVPELLRKLKARGYAPVDTGDVVNVPPLPEDPSAKPEPAAVRPKPGKGKIKPTEVKSLEVDKVLKEPKEIAEALELAVDDELELEVTYRVPGEPTQHYLMWPSAIEGKKFFAYLNEDEFGFMKEYVSSAKWTGRRAP